jgi:hypothetical protein
LRKLFHYLFLFVSQRFIKIVFGGGRQTRAPSTVPKLGSDHSYSNWISAGVSLVYHWMEPFPYLSQLQQLDFRVVRGIGVTPSIGGTPSPLRFQSARYPQGV